MTTKGEFIDNLRTVFDKWEKLLAGMSEGEVTAPLGPGEWSISEVITHLWAWQQISIARLEAVCLNTDLQFPTWLGGADPFYAEEHVDDFNARIQETQNGQSWSRRHRDWREGFLHFLELAEEIGESDMMDTNRCPWLGGYALSAVLEGSCGHHQEHLDHILARTHGDKIEGT
jgi:hypothetical protein